MDIVPKPPIKKVRAVFLQDGKMLIVPSTRRKGYFVLPGGHVEAEEELVGALIRELQEELSVQVQSQDLEWLGVFTLKAPQGRGKIITDVYFIKAWEGVLTPTGDITSMQWVSPEELTSNKLRYGSDILRHVVPFLKKRRLL